MKLAAVLACMAILAPTLAEAQRATGPRMGKEVQLFNGKDLSGWTYHLSDPAAKMSDVWSVDPVDGVLICKGRPAGYIRTEKAFSDFVLKLEWRFSPITKRAGNSGVLLRIVGPDMVWPKSVEAQLQSGSAGDIWLIEGAALETARDRIDRSATRHRLHARSNEKPIGEWNAYEITCNRGNVTLKVNGLVLNEGSGADLLSGTIGLQSEGSEIHFRNVRLTPILR